MSFLTSLNKIGSENEECQITIHQVHSPPSAPFHSYDLINPGKWINGYSNSNYQYQESVGIELESSVTLTVQMIEHGLDEDTPITIPREMFGTILPAVYYRLFCLQNAHGTPMGCVFISKAWMLFKWGIKCLIRETLKTASFSKTERMKDGYDNTHDGTQMRNSFRACLSLEYDNDNDNHKRFVADVVQKLIDDTGPLDSKMDDEKRTPRTWQQIKPIIKGLGEDQFECEEDDDYDDEEDHEEENICTKIVNEHDRKRVEMKEKLEAEEDEARRKSDEMRTDKINKMLEKGKN